MDALTPHQLREYAAQAMEWAMQAKNDFEKEAFLYMSKTWAQAALWRDAHMPPPSAKQNTISP